MVSDQHSSYGMSVLSVFWLRATCVPCSEHGDQNAVLVADKVEGLFQARDLFMDLAYSDSVYIQ